MAAIAGLQGYCVRINVTRVKISGTDLQQIEGKTSFRIIKLLFLMFG